MSNEYPKLHNAMWPGLVGKGSPGAEPAIDLDTMLDLTAKAEVNGTKFDGVDLFLFDPHVSIDSSDEDILRLAEKIQSRGLVIGSVVAPVWPPTGGGSAIGTPDERKQFVKQVEKACRIAQKLRELGARPWGVVRIDSACSPSDWAKEPKRNTRLIAQTFSLACDVAEAHGERLAAEGEICWGGMHSWRQMVKLLQMVNRPKTLGFQADMAHTLLYTMGFNAPEDAILPQNWDWSDSAKLDEALKTLTAALRPWTIDFHVAQNDATVKGSGSHDKTGRHCLPTDPNGKLNIAFHAGYWLRDENGEPTKAVKHICWDGCMFPNDVMMKQETWNDILSTMIAVRDMHGWNEEQSAEGPSGNGETETLEVFTRRTTTVAEKPAPKKPAAKKKASKPAAKKKKVKAKVKAKAKPAKKKKSAPKRSKSKLPAARRKKVAARKPAKKSKRR
jgi:sugar phosphate isomerase/epimerase